MTSLHCPEWRQPEPDEKLLLVVQGIAEFFRFTIRAAKSRQIISAHDLRTFHGQIFRNVAPLPYYAGYFRCVDKNYPCLNQRVFINTTGKMGAPPDKVYAEMSAFSASVRKWTSATDRYVESRPTETNRVAAAAQLAAQSMGELIRIHPFVNGNGRMSRLLANFFCFRYSYPMPFSDAHIRPAPGAGYESACDSSMSGDHRPLFLYIVTLLGNHVAKA